jgi:hypothetical protein
MITTEGWWRMSENAKKPILDRLRIKIKGQPLDKHGRLKPWGGKLCSCPACKSLPTRSVWRGKLFPLCDEHYKQYCDERYTEAVEEEQKRWSGPHDGDLWTEGEDE